MDTFLSRITSLLADTSPKAVATVKYILAILDGKVTIPGGITLLLVELACDGYVNPEIDDAHFPGADAFVSTTGVRPVDIGMDWTDPEALAKLDSMGLQPVMPDKGIKWASENKDAQRKNPLVILGQKCRLSGGSVCVLVLRECGGERCARLSAVQSRFYRGCLVLAEPKE
jgi:hypothetical protein